MKTIKVMPKEWKQKVGKRLEKAGLSKKRASDAVKALWRGMRTKCKTKAVKKYGAK